MDWLQLDWSQFDAERYRGHEEQDILSILPPNGFLREWVYYGIAVSDGHAAYHAMNALTLLSVATPPSVHLPDGDRLPANFFAMVVGPSQESRKSFSVRAARQVLASIKGGSNFLMGTPGSGEWLVDEVIAQPRVLITIEEGANFFGLTSSKGDAGYLDKLRARLVEMSDSVIQQRGTVEKARSSRIKGKPEKDAREEAKKIEMNPRVSMIVAIAPPFLEDFTLIHDWTGGFVPRYCLCYAERRRHYPRSARVYADWELSLSAHLARLLAVEAGVGPCTGFTMDANAYWDWWVANRVPQKPPEKARSLVERSYVHARKAALIAAYDEHMLPYVYDVDGRNSATKELPWAVQTHHVAFGCAVAEIHIASGLRLVATIAETPDRRLMHRIQRYLAEHGQVGRHEIYKLLGLDSLRTDRLIKTLEAMHEVATTSDHGFEEVMPYCHDHWLRDRGLGPAAQQPSGNVVDLPTRTRR